MDISFQTLGTHFNSIYEQGTEGTLITIGILTLYDGISTRSVSKSTAGLCVLGGGFTMSLLGHSLHNALSPYFPFSLMPKLSPRSLSSTTSNIYRGAGAIATALILKFYPAIVPAVGPGP